MSSVATSRQTVKLATVPTSEGEILAERAWLRLERARLNRDVQALQAQIGTARGTPQHRELLERLGDVKHELQTVIAWMKNAGDVLSSIRAKNMFGDNCRLKAFKAVVRQHVDSQTYAAWHQEAAALQGGAA